MRTRTPIVSEKACSVQYPLRGVQDMPYSSCATYTVNTQSRCYNWQRWTPRMLDLTLERTQDTLT